MKALKLIFIALLFIVALFLIAGLFAPNQQSVSKATIIKAPASAIFLNIKFIDKMAFWHPFLKKDKNVKISVNGQDGTPGAVRFWNSDVNIVGVGSDEIIEIIESTLFKSKIEILEPRKSNATSTFTLKEIDKGTKVTWTFDYEVPYPFNAFLLFGKESSDLGKYFAEGLTGLKNTLERYERNEVKYSLANLDYQGGTFICKKINGTWEEIEAAIPAAYDDIIKLRDVANLNSHGSPIGLIHSWSNDDIVEYSFGIPVSSTDNVPSPFIVELQPKDGCKAVYINDLYGTKIKAHTAIKKQLNNQGISFDYPIIEEYKKGKLTGDKTVATRLIYQVNK